MQRCRKCCTRRLLPADLPSLTMWARMAKKGSFSCSIALTGAKASRAWCAKRQSRKSWLADAAHTIARGARSRRDVLKRYLKREGAHMSPFFDWSGIDLTVRRSSRVAEQIDGSGRFHWDNCKRYRWR